MSRNYESNGPDVKIRGNAAHIADKYSSLARDALSNGDTVMAENYLQHAEHYNRIIAAAQAQRAEENVASNGRGPQPDVAESGTEQSAENETTTEENAEGGVQAEASDETSEAPKERKNGRGRRTRRAASEANGEEKSGDTKAKPADEDVVVVEPEIISEDAASLPQSITGGASAEDN